VTRRRSGALAARVSPDDRSTKGQHAPSMPRAQRRAPSTVGPWHRRARWQPTEKSLYTLYFILLKPDGSPQRSHGTRHTGMAPPQTAARRSYFILYTLYSSSSRPRFTDSHGFAGRLAKQTSSGSQPPSLPTLPGKTQAGCRQTAWRCWHGRRRRAAPGRQSLRWQRECVPSQLSMYTVYFILYTYRPA